MKTIGFKAPDGREIGEIMDDSGRLPCEKCGWFQFEFQHGEKETKMKCLRCGQTGTITSDGKIEDRYYK